MDEVAVVVRVGTDVTELQQLPPEVQRTVNAMQGGLAGVEAASASASSAISRVGGAVTGVMGAVTQLGAVASAIGALGEFGNNWQKSLSGIHTGIMSAGQALNGLGPIGPRISGMLSSLGQSGREAGRAVKGSVDESRKSVIALGPDASRTSKIVAAASSTARQAVQGVGQAAGAVGDQIQRIQPATRAIGSVGQAAQVTARELTSVGRAGQQVNQSLGETDGRAAKLSSSLGNLGTVTTRAFNNINSSVSKAATDIQVLAGSNKKVEDSASSAEGALKRQGQAVDAVGSASQGAGGKLGVLSDVFSAVRSRLGDMGISTDRFKLALAGAGVAIVGVVAAMKTLQVAADLAKKAIALDDVYGIAYDNLRVGIGATGAELDKFATSLNNVAKGTPTDLVTLGGIMSDIRSRTGATGPVLEQLTQQIANLSRITGTDAKMNVQLLTRTMGDLGIPIEQQSAALDVLFRASQNTGVGIDRLSQLMTQFGAPLRNFGFSFKEGAALLSRFEQQGVNTELVMGSLRIAGGKLADAGIDLREGLKGAISQIQAAESSSQATAIAMEIFGARAGPDMADTIRGGRFAIEEFVAALESNTDTINKASNDILGWREHMQIAKNTVIAAILPMATAFADKMAKGVQMATTAFTNFANSPAGQKIGQMLWGLFNFLSKNFIPIIIFLSSVAIGGLIVAFVALAPILMPIIGVLVGLAGAALSALAPFIALGAGLALVAALIIRHWERIREFFGALFSGDFSAAADMGKQALADFGAWVGGWVDRIFGEGTWGKVVSTVFNAFTAVRTAINSLVEGFQIGRAVGDNFIQAISNAFANMAAAFGDSPLGRFAQGVSDGINDAYNAIVERWQAAIDWLTSTRDSIVSAVGGAWQTARDTVANAVNAILEFVRGWASEHQTLLMAIGIAFALMTAPIWLPIAALVGMKAAWDQNLGGIRDKVAEVVDGIKSAWEGLAGIFGGGAEKTDTATVAMAGSMSALGASATATSGLISADWSGMADNVSSTTDTLSGWLQGAWSTISGFVGSINTAIRTKTVAAWNFIKTNVSSIVATLGNWLRNAWHTVATFIMDVKTKLANAIVKAWNWIKTRIGAIVTPLGKWLGEAWHKIGSVIAIVQDKVAEAISKAWNGILGIFKAVATPIINGLKALFTGVVKIVKQGMTAAGGIVDAVMTGIANRIASIGSMLGPLGGKISEMASHISGSAKGWMAEIGASLDGLTSRIGDGLGGIVSAFGGAIGGVREKAAGLFSGMGGGLDLAGMSGDEVTFDPGTGLGGAGADLSGLGESGGGGGGGSESKAWQSPDGMSGGDADGSEWYIDPDTGQKIYTSGPGMNRQQAKMRGQEAKASEAAGKKQAAADRASKGPSVAQTMADTASKVADAIQKGLDSIRALSDTDIPGEEIWRPKLAIIEQFVSASLESFQNMGKGLLSQIGSTAEGEELMDTKEAKAIVGVASMVGNVLGGMAKAMSFLQATRTAKMPEPEQVDAALGMVFDLLTRIRDRGLELASVFEADGEDDPAQAFQAAGQGLMLWVDMWGKVTEGAVKLGQSAKDIAAAPGAMAQVETIFGQVANLSGRLVSAFEAAVPEEDRARMLILSRNVGQTIEGWMAPVIRLGEGAEAIAKIPKIPATIGTHIEDFMFEVARISGLLVGGLERAIASRIGRQEALELSRDVANTFDVQFGMLNTLGEAARNIRNIAKIPPTVTSSIQSFLMSVAAITGSFVMALQSGIKEHSDQLAALEVSRAVSDAFRSAIEMIALLATSAQGIADIPRVPPDALTRIHETLQRVAGILHGFVVGPGYDLLKDAERSLRDLGVVQAVVQTLQSGITLLGSVAELANKWSEAQPLTPDMVDEAIRRADMVRQKLTEWAQKWTAGMDDITEDVAELRKSLDPYLAILKDTIGAFMDASKLSLAEVSPIQDADIQMALDNAQRVLTWVQAWAHEWLLNLQRGRARSRDRRSITEVIEAVSAEVANYMKVVKDAIGLATDAGKLSLKDIMPINDDDIRIALDNAQRVAGAVQVAAREWARALAEAGEKMADVVAENEAFNKIVGPAVKLIGETNEVLLKLSEKVAPTGLRDAIDRLKHYIELIVLGLAEVFDNVEMEAGRLKKADDLAKVLSPAAEALAKTLDALSLEKLLKSPLVNTKLQSGWMTKVTEKRLTALGTQISDGIRRTVMALVDGLSGIVVPDDLGAGLDRIAGVLDKFITLIERIRDLELGASIQAKVAEVRAIMAELVAVAGTVGASGGGGASGAGGAPGGGMIGDAYHDSGPIQPNQPVVINVKLDGKTIETLFTSTMGASARGDSLAPDGVG